jgi:hypothetical protein
MENVAIPGPPVLRSNAPVWGASRLWARQIRQISASEVSFRATTYLRRLDGDSAAVAEQREVYEAAVVAIS